ncbi:uncharacterized protein LOC119369916 [Jatropha curcas]|uniref:uncharacterized protein LOC119369916 n=1 Tax=Jatropha curcas TaxID=180498 RepID=UPI0018932D5E|nr:uncharacterized protein LOC119369916 [Jatropha curcas]
MNTGKSGETSGEGNQLQDPQLKLFMESIQGQFRSYNNFLQDMREELQEIKAAQSSNTTRARINNTPPTRFQIPNDDEVDNLEVSTVDGDLGSIKMKIPEFYGNNNAEEYLEWERKVEQIFECHHYSEEKKSHLAAIEFKGYAMFWWEQLLLKRGKKGMRPVSQWETMKELMHQKFVPAHYFRDLHNKLARLVQGNSCC